MSHSFRSYRFRRLSGLLFGLAAVAGLVLLNPDSYETIVAPGPAEASSTDIETPSTNAETGGASASNISDIDGASTPNSSGQNILAVDLLAQLPIKGRAPKTGYARTEFYNNWPTVNGCSLRQLIIKRELGESAVLDGCNVVAGTYAEPYTGVVKTFTEKSQLSSGIQIDHVVALSDAWQKGAQQLTPDERYQLATDPLNLLAVDSNANQQKSDGDAATWLPSNKPFRCQYIARQISVKHNYRLWVTQAEHDAMSRVLSACSNEPAVGVSSTP